LRFRRCTSKAGGIKSQAGNSFANGDAFSMLGDLTDELESSIGFGGISGLFFASISLTQRDRHQSLWKDVPLW
jgi:hypothetical protein